MESWLLMKISWGYIGSKTFVKISTHILFFDNAKETSDIYWHYRKWMCGHNV